MMRKRSRAKSPAQMEEGNEEKAEQAAVDIERSRLYIHTRALYWLCSAVVRSRARRNAYDS